MSNQFQAELIPQTELGQYLHAICMEIVIFELSDSITEKQKELKSKLINFLECNAPEYRETLQTYRNMYGMLSNNKEEIRNVCASKIMTMPNLIELILDTGVDNILESCKILAETAEDENDEKFKERMMNMAETNMWDFWDKIMSSAGLLLIGRRTEREIATKQIKRDNTGSLGDKNIRLRNLPK